MELIYSTSSSNTEDVKFVNILEDVQKSVLGPTLKSLRDFNPPQYKHAKFNNPELVWKSALASDRVQHIIKQISDEEEKSIKQVTSEASKILKEMAHTDHMSVVRTLGFALMTIAKQIYPGGLFLNVAAIDSFKESMTNCPAVFIPSHRSYMDFLIFSVICFCVDLPLPAIAAGMDFMGMKFVGEALRSSGAFFMRRSFGKDRLYWALFTEYVHSVIIGGPRSLEFFIEGTRSRTGKSLNPKLGLLSIVAEPFLKGKVYDTLIVPVSISYKRILEENLYAYEMLGIPKPKESTSGLLAATSVLQENYGNIYVKLNEPISLRTYFSKVDRLAHAQSPLHLQNLSAFEQDKIKLLAYHIVKVQQCNMVVNVFPAICFVLTSHGYSMRYSNLVQEMKWFDSLCKKLNVSIHCNVNGLESSIHHALNMFSHIVAMNTVEDQSSTVYQQVDVVEKSSGLNTPNLGNKLAAVNYILLSHYRNQIIDKFVGIGLLFLSAVKNHDISLVCENIFSADDLYNDFSFICDSLKHEFIFIPGYNEALFRQSLEKLVELGAFEVTSDGIKVNKHSSKLFTFLSTIFKPFITLQLLSLQYFSIHGNFVELRASKKSLQQFVYKNVGLNTSLLHIVSLNMISNAISSLLDRGCLRLSKVSGKTWVFSSLDCIDSHFQRLQPFVDFEVSKCSKVIASKL